jgi:RNA polymerase sigma-70 factor (ECF subfamily)
VSDAGAAFGAHRDEIVRYLTRLVGQAEAARDLTQEVFLRASRATVPDVPADRRAWVFTIARNLGLNYLRDAHRRPAIEPLADAASSAPSQESALVVQQALAALEHLERDIFLMREIAGLSYDEIARASGLTTAAVRCRLYRARMTLRELLSAPLDAQRRVGIRLSEKSRS